MNYYRIDENGETYWTGKAHSEDDALERCYDEGGPGSLVNITLYQWKYVNLSRTMKAKAWSKVWEGRYA